MSLAKTGSNNTLKRGTRGHAMVEVALMCPWILLLFMGIFDFGFYTYAAIATQNAANVAALYTSSDWGRQTDATNACGYALQEMSKLPNMSGITTCDALPLMLTATSNPLPCLAGAACDATVSVTYQTVPLFPIPGLMGRMTLTRTTTTRVHPEL